MTTKTCLTTPSRNRRLSPGLRVPNLSVVDVAAGGVGDDGTADRNVVMEERPAVVVASAVVAAVPTTRAARAEWRAFISRPPSITRTAILISGTRTKRSAPT